MSGKENIEVKNVSWVLPKSECPISVEAGAGLSSQKLRATELHGESGISLAAAATVLRQPLLEAWPMVHLQGQ